jgi:hypothetical protein
VRRRSTAAIGVVLLLLLAGCSPTDSLVPPLELRSDVKMTPAEARADLARHSDDLEEILGGRWEHHDNSLASGCADDKGFYYFGARVRQDAVTDTATAAGQVMSWWKKRGYTVTHHVYQNDHLLHGVAPNGMTIDLSLGDGYTDFAADGPCIPGDWAAIRLDDGDRVRKEMRKTSAPTPTPTP